MSKKLNIEKDIEKILSSFQFDLYDGTTDNNIKNYIHNYFIENKNENEYTFEEIKYNLTKRRLEVIFYFNDQKYTFFIN